MSRQKGIINFEGKAGNFSFFKSRNGGYGAREATGINGDRIRNDASFERTRENGMEFGKAGKAGKLVRTAFRTLTMSVADGRMTSRMTKAMVTVIQSDSINARGQRKPSAGDNALLRGFEFNSAAPLAQTILTPYEASINKTAGSGQVSIPAFVPSQMIAYPKGAHLYPILHRQEGGVDICKMFSCVAVETHRRLAKGDLVKTVCAVAAHFIFFRRLVDRLYRRLRS
jgi:hypothetical protein